MKKNVIKFGAGIFGLVIIGGAVWYGVLSYQRKNSPEYAMTQEYEKLSEAYKNDTYGGATPEETLRLFIDALKAGDTELAAKYFVVEEWEKQRADLLAGKNNGTIEKFIDFLSSVLKNGSGNFKDDTIYILEVINSKNEVEFSFILIKNSNNKWKILEL